METLLELQRGDGIAVGVLGQLLVLQYLETPTMVTARVLDLAVKTPQVLGLMHPLVLVVVEATSRAPEASVRAAIQKTLQKNEARTEALAYTILDAGFAGATARAVVSGILLFVRPQYPAKVFASLSDASRWLLSRQATSLADTLESWERLKWADQLDAIQSFCGRAQGSPRVPTREYGMLRDRP